MANLTKKSGWLESFHQSLSSLDNYVQSQSCGIYLVPEDLKKCNLDAYMPRVVSIGPRFIGREDLLPMEEVKLRCMMSLLHRGTGQASERLELCGETIKKLVAEEVRASYAPDIVELEKLSDIDLAKIMLVDGCFLLELFISKGLNPRFPSRLIPSGPAAELINNDDVLSDLMLFENQIPICVLFELCRTLFPELSHELASEWTKVINDLVLYLLGYSSSHQITIVDTHKGLHVLDIVCFYINTTRTGEPCKEEDHHHVVVNIIKATQPQQQLKLNRCALRLLTAGVAIKAIIPDDKHSTRVGALSCLSSMWKSLFGILFWFSNIFVVKGKHMVDHVPEARSLDFYFGFQNRKLEILQLHITKATKAKWCNLIALEHHQKIQSINNQKTNPPGGCDSTYAALIFNNLICSADDVQFLKDKKIIVDHVKRSNQELMEFFREIALGIDHRVFDSSSEYIQMVEDINNFSKAFLIKRIWSTLWNSLTYRQEWLFRFLNHNYNFVATVISLCTVVQTIYTIIAYQLPK